jgi:hypothetical protein
LGAPGFYHWRGSILETESIKLGTTNNFAKENFVLHRNSGIQIGIHLNKFQVFDSENKKKFP